MSVCMRVVAVRVGKRRNDRGDVKESASLSEVRSDRTGISKDTSSSCRVRISSTHGEQQHRSCPPLDTIDIVLAYVRVRTSEQLDEKVGEDSTRRCRGREQEQPGSDLGTSELLREQRRR